MILYINIIYLEKKISSKVLKNVFNQKEGNTRSVSQKTRPLSSNISFNNVNTSSNVTPQININISTTNSNSNTILGNTSILMGTPTPKGTSFVSFNSESRDNKKNSFNTANSDNILRDRKEVLLLTYNINFA